MSRKKQVNVRFGQWLDTTMANSRISGRELAQKVGVHDSVVSRWRSGASTPGIETAAKLAEALGVDPLRLAVTAGLIDAQMAGVQPLPAPPPTALRERVRDQVADIKGLTDDMRQALLEAFDHHSVTNEE